MTSAQKTRNVLQNKQKQKFPPTHPPLKKKKNHAMYKQNMDMLKEKLITFLFNINTTS